MPPHNNKRSGKFSFIVKQKSGNDIEGELDWIGNYVGKIKEDHRYDCTISMRSSILVNGELDKDQIRQITGHISLTNLDKLQNSGSIQQDLLINFINEIKKNHFKLDNVYQSDMKFISVLYQDGVENNKKNSKIGKIFRSINRKIIGSRKLVEFSHIKNRKRPKLTSEVKRKSKKRFQFIVIGSGIITIILCILFVKIDISKAFIALFASIAAWAAREELLVDKVTSDDRDYSHDRHWRGSLWKLVGYISTAIISVTVLSGISDSFNR